MSQKLVTGIRTAGEQDAEERKAIQALLNKVNRAGPRDPMHRHLLALIKKRDDAPAVRAIAGRQMGVMQVSAKASATGALTFRPALVRDSYGRVDLVPVLDRCDLEEAGPGVLEYGYWLLLAESRNHLTHLARCSLCGSFFMAPRREGRGAKRRLYCGAHDEDLAAKRRAETRERVRTWREAQKTARKPK